MDFHPLFGSVCLHQISEHPSHCHPHFLSVAKALFNRARLYVAVHGGGMSNMLFMPFQGSLLEISPHKYPNACYHFLAEVCSLAYYSVVGEGDKDSSTNVDMGEMKRVLADIAAKMEAQL